MTHIEFAAVESAALEPTIWSGWIARAERLAGHSLDGHGEIDGYSLDDAHDAWEAGQSPAEYVQSIRRK